MRHEGVLIPYAVLCGKRRGDRISESETQALRIAISRIRKSLGTGPARPRLDTESRVGYRLVAPEA
jgi:DNA-binding response OmpR family regulator